MTVESRLSRVTSAMDAALPVLAQCVDRLADLLGDRERTYDKDMASHLVWLVLQMAGISTELRQLEKHDRVMTRTPEQRWALVCEYVKRELSPRQRTELATMLEEIKNARVVA